MIDSVAARRRRRSSGMKRPKDTTVALSVRDPGGTRSCICEKAKHLRFRGRLKRLSEKYGEHESSQAGDDRRPKPRRRRVVEMVGRGHFA